MIFTGWCITTIIVNGSIFEGMRNYLIVKSPFFGKLVSCIMCLGLWVGVILHWPLMRFGVAPMIITGKAFWLSYVFIPFIQSGSGVLIESAIIFLIKKAPRSDI
jgi:hypothetical protein